jgi:lysylphosphatidylglycerol synthetase-like protein (DUF2156 family)
MDREKLVEYVRNWSTTSTDAILDPACRIFTIPDVEGFIGYGVASGYAVVFGEPLCAKKDKPLLANAFQEYCKGQNLGVIYVIVSEDFARRIVNPSGSVLINFGDQLMISPVIDPCTHTGPKAIRLRNKVRMAIKHGVTVTEYLSGDSKLEEQIEQIPKKWLNNRHGPQIYMGNISLFTNRKGKRWFYAKQNGQLVGVLILSQLKEEQGWLLNNSLVTPDASHGTSELLVVTSLNVLKNENCSKVIYGPIAQTELGKIEGLGKISTWLMRLIYRVIRKVMHLDSHIGFWGKFFDQNEPSFILFNQKPIGPKAVIAILKVFNLSNW